MTRKLTHAIFYMGLESFYNACMDYWRLFFDEVGIGILKISASSSPPKKSASVGYYGSPYFNILDLQNIDCEKYHFLILSPPKC